MNIIEALLNEELSIRITNGDKWMYFDNLTKRWVVKAKISHTKDSVTLLVTTSEEEAVHKLIEE